MIELNYNSIASIERQGEKFSVNLDEENRLPFKQGHQVLKCLSHKMLVPKGAFEATLFMISPGRKG